MKAWPSLGLLLLSGALLAEQDPCLLAIPKAVASAVAARFPDYRLPFTDDSDPAAVELNRKNGGSGCNAVASADFNGDGKPDYAMVLTSQSNGTPRLVVALSSRSGYSLSSLRAFEARQRKRLYVDPLSAGRFTRTESADSDTLEKDELPALSSKRPGIAVGVVESWELGYFLTAKGWRWIWLAN